MAETWQTIEQAAVSLRMSVRTVNRHISAGKLESRLKEGRREVAVTLPDVSPVADASEPSSVFANGAEVGSTGTPTEQKPDGGASANATTNASPVSVDAERFLALADNATQKAEMAVNAYQMLARTADTQVRQVRRQARFAWSTVAVMTIAVMVAIGWTTQRLTQSAGEISNLKEAVVTETKANDVLTVEQEKLRAERLQAERTLREEMANKLASAKAEQSAAELSLRNEVTAARESAAESQGALKAYRERDEASEAQRRSVEGALHNQAITAAELIPAPEEVGTPRILAAPATQPTASSPPTAKPSDLSASPTTKPVAPRHKAKAATTKPLSSPALGGAATASPVDGN